MTETPAAKLLRFLRLHEHGMTEAELRQLNDEVVRLIRSRVRTNNYEAKQELIPGDRVRFVQGKPKYLIGATGFVTQMNPSKAKITLDAPAGRYPRGTILTAPYSLLEKIS